jgi:hypothetical protein
MKKLFILGAGFSKAFSQEMPLMKDLASCIDAEIKKFDKDSVYRKFGTDIEGLLTYLYQEVPWRPDYDSKHDEGLLLKLLDCIGEHIAKCEEKAFKKEPPDWAKQFVNYIHDKELTIATFNYDTILEKLSKGLKLKVETGSNLDIFSIYRIPISLLKYRIGLPIWDGISTDYHTYRLIKLHGSINWYFAREGNLLNMPVYYMEVNEDRYEFGNQEGQNEFIKISKMDLKPLIIPPVAEKSPFYGNQLVKILWAELKKAVNDADEIYCVGYSLPKTDYTTQIFFSAVINKDRRKVYIVNRKCGSDDLIKNYKEALPNCELITDYITNDEPVAKMVMALK